VRLAQVLHAHPEPVQQQRPGRAGYCITGLPATDLADGRHVILYQAGRSTAGARAMRSHTAAVASDHAVVRDLAESVGVTIAETLGDFADLVRLYTLLDATPPRGWQLGAISNLNIAPELRALASDVIEPEVGRRIRDAGVRYHEYLVGGPPEERRLRFSTTDINDSRQSMGIYNTLSFLIEGKRWDDPSAHIGSRTAGQVVAMRSFLETVASHAEEIRETVDQARASLIVTNSDLPPIHIRQDYVPDPDRPSVRYPIFDLRTWTSREAELGNFEPTVVSLLSVDRPWGYAIPAGLEDLIELLGRHRIRFVRLASPAMAAIERYRIEKAEEVMVEDKKALDISVHADRGEFELEAGTVIVPTRQAAASLIPLLLEPQSLWAPYGERGGRDHAFDELLEVGTVFPVVRIIEAMDGLTEVPR